MFHASPKQEYTIQIPGSYDFCIKATHHSHP